MSASHSVDIKPVGQGKGLTCPLCVDKLLSPRILSCLHTFCERCLELYIIDMKASAKDGTISAFFCPVCKQPANIGALQRSPRDIVSDLPLNMLMDRAPGGFSTPGVRNWRKDTKKFVHFSQFCGWCLKDNLTVKATTYCHGCGEFRCRRCVNKHVGDRMNDIDHNVVDIEEMSAVTASKISEEINKYTMCKEHPEEELKFYCLDHEVLLCRKCDVPDHMKCRLAEDFEGLSKTVSQIKEASKMREEMSGLKDDLAFMVETLRENNNEIVKQSQAVSMKVHSMKETIIQLFEELEESASDTIKRSRERVAKQNSGKAFKMKQLLSAIEGSCSVLDSVSEHGTHRQLFTVFQKLKQQLQIYAALVRQEKDGLVRTSVIIEIDKDLESLIGGFDKVGEVRLESKKVEFPDIKLIIKKSQDIDIVKNEIMKYEDINDSRVYQNHSYTNSEDAIKLLPDSTKNDITLIEEGDVLEKGTQTELNKGEQKSSVDPGLKMISVSTNIDGNIIEGHKSCEEENTLRKADGDAISSYNNNENQTRSGSKQTKISTENQGTKSKQMQPTENVKSQHKELFEMEKGHRNSEGTTTHLQKDKLSRKGSSIDNTPNNATMDFHSSLLPMSETISRLETDVTVLLDIPSNLNQWKAFKQDNPNKSRHCIAVCTIEEAIILVFKTVKRTGLSYNFVVFDLESLTELKTMEIKKEPKEAIAYDSRHFAITFPEVGFVDFFAFRPAGPKKKKRPATPAEVILEKSVKCNIRSATLCRFRKDEFALSTSNYFGTLGHDGSLTKLFYYSMSLRSVETNFWRTQLSVVKLAFDNKNDVIYAATTKPFRLFSFTVFGEVLSETVLDAAITSLELDMRKNVFVCYNNGTDGVGRVRQVVVKADTQRTVILDNSNPGFVCFSRKCGRFYVIENQTNATKIEEYELGFPGEDIAMEQDDADTIPIVND